MEKRANKTITLRIKDDTKKKMAVKSHRDTAPGDETVGRHEESDVGGEDEEGGGDVQLQQINFQLFFSFLKTNLREELADNAGEAELQLQPGHRGVAVFVQCKLS